MPEVQKIRAIVTSHHYPGDPEDAPDRLFRVRPQANIEEASPREVISDIHSPDNVRYLVDVARVYRLRANTSGDSPIEILIDPSFFSETNRPKAYDQLWFALMDAYDLLDDL